VIEYDLTANNRAGLDERLNRLDLTATVYHISVKPKKSKRSTEQNSRLWALYNALGQHIGLESDEIHQLMGFKFLRYQKYVGDEIEEFIKSTTKLTTAEMTEYQESIERWAEQAGFYFDGDE
jgi:hypothetical protein